MALKEYPRGSLMLYLDGDTLIFASLEQMVQDFLASKSSIGLALEGDTRFHRATMDGAWTRSDIPEQYFPHYADWRHKNIYNTGVMLAIGDKAVEVGERTYSLYEDTKAAYKFAEQTIIDSVIYEDNISVFDLAVQQHCFIFEDFIEHNGENAYTDSAPMIDGKPILIRHFCAHGKEILNRILPGLRSKYK